MNLRGRLHCGSALALLLYGTPSVGHACPDINRLLLPFDGQADVPTNARVWLSDEDVPVYYDDFVLESSDGVRVDLDVRAIDGQRIANPVASLSPNTDYVLLSCVEATCDTVVRGFSTAALVDDEPPERPEVVERREFSDRSCSETSWFELDIEHAGVVVLDFQAPSFDVGTLTGSDLIMSSEETVFLGAWQKVVYHGEPFRIGVVDIAGNFSGWEEAEPLHPPTAGCICATHTPRRIDLSLLLALVFVSRRRRDFES